MRELTSLTEAYRNPAMFKNRSENHLNMVLNGLKEFQELPEEESHRQLDSAIDSYLNFHSTVFIMKNFLMEWLEAHFELKYMEQIKNEEIRESIEN